MKTLDMTGSVDPTPPTTFGERGGSQCQAFEPASRAQWLLAGCAFLVFLALNIGHLLTFRPFWDEGVFADMALSFRNFGHLGSSVLDPQSWGPLPGVHQYTYFQFPLYLITVGSWFHLVPATLVWMRLFSLLWGCVYVVSWFVVVRCLSRKEALALFVASVVALDYACLIAASLGRMDMMCAGLGLAGLACYFWFRESNWTLGVVLAAWLGAASLFCHPMGAVTNAWLATMVLLDWRRIRWGALIAASIPYLIGLACCLYYIHQAPDIFWAQIRPFRGRVSGLGSILRHIRNDFLDRYLRYQSWGHDRYDRFKFMFLVFPVVGTAGLLADRDLRSLPVAKRLLLLACVAYLGVAVIDNTNFFVYHIYSVPTFAACAALWVYGRWRKGGLGRLLASGLLAASILVSMGAIGYRIYLNGYRNIYDPTVAAIRKSLPPGGLVMAGSEFGFALGFGPKLVDDPYFGVASGKVPDVRVANRYGGPVVYSHVSPNPYYLVFQNAAYSVYVRDVTSAQRQPTN